MTVTIPFPFRLGQLFELIIKFNKKCNSLAAFLHSRWVKNLKFLRRIFEKTFPRAILILIRIDCLVKIFFKNMREFLRDKQYDRQCNICYIVCESKVTACGHCFCHSCLVNESVKNCPECRNKLDKSQIISLCDAAEAGRRVYN